MYRKFYLKPGQQAPNGSTGKTLEDGGIVWIGEQTDFPAEIESYAMTDAEVFGYHKSRLEPAIDKHIDQVAKDKEYGRVNLSPSAACLGYAAFVNPYQAEAIAFGEWIASLWPVVNQIMADVQDGTRAIPTEAELIAELPEMVWP